MRKYSGSSRCQPFKGSWRRHAAVTLQKGVAPKRTTKKSCMLRSDERQHLQNQGTPEIVKTQIPLPYELGVFGLFGISAMLLPAP